MSKWSDEEAKAFCKRYAAHGEDLALRVYTTRLLGQDPTLVLHGGGNTSVKTVKRDELGRDVSVLCVKGSGWDMGWIEPEGLPVVCLEPLREFRALEAMTDEAMVNGVRRYLLDTTAPTPSVETLLHAFLPHKFVDHTHADAILALADQPDAASLCRELFGVKFGIVPYIMPGFALAKETARIYETDPGVEGLILINHGIFTFGETASEAYERMIEAVSAARRFLKTKAKTAIYLEESKPVEKGTRYFEHLAILRGCLSARTEGIGHQVLHWRKTDQIDAFLDLPDLTEQATRGPATPDHVIRTKQKPLVIESIEDDPAAFKNRLDAMIERYIRAYQSYFKTQTEAKGVDKKQVHPLPVVFLIRGIGLVTAGKTEKDAKIAADIYEHTIDVILKAGMIGDYQPLPDDLLFDMEYWSLEQAKLGKKAPPPMAGKIVLVTGACGGIGRATAEKFAAMGANLVLTDLDGEALESLGNALAKTHKTGVAVYPADITDENAVEDLVRFAACRFGGLDAVVSNAGAATTEPIARATVPLKKSLQINLLSHQYLASASARLMEQQGAGGCLLFNASKSAFNPGPGFGAYAVAKAGLIALMKQYAVEYAGSRIRSMAVNADRIRTNLFDPDLLEARARARGLTPDDYFRANMLGVEVLADDVADAFYHLYQSSKSTGTVLTVDGGNIAASPR